MDDSRSSQRVSIDSVWLPWILLGALFTLYLVVLVRSAWVSDDAFITLRAVDNLVNGYGPTWNVAERVQAFTDPLWMLLLAAVYSVSREAYFTILGVSIVTSISSVVILAVATSRTVWNAVLALTILAFSRAFVDFSTSGLETPLSFLCLAAFVAVWTRTKDDARKASTLVLIASLAATTRLDTLLIYAPALTVVVVNLVRRSSAGRSIKIVVTSALPLIAWEAFALLYYGFPFPNTYYAKLQTGIPAPQSLLQGFFYLVESVKADPLTVPVICLAIALPIVVGDGMLRSLSIGILAYVVYVTWIGGDFMNGRFFALPLFASALVVALFPIGRHRSLLMLATIAFSVVVGLVSPDSTVKTGADFTYLGEPHAVYDDVMKNHHGVADERRGYFAETGLLNYRPGNQFPTGPLASAAANRNRDAKNGVVVGGMIGMQGYLAGPRVLIVDYMALGDPLLARLPAMPGSRIGHFRRGIPAGYVETLMAGQNQIADPDLALFYDKLSLITRGPLFAPERLRTIVAMNLGRYDHLTRNYNSHPGS